MNVLITGASRGIGYELANYFCSAGVEKLFLLSRNKEKIAELKKNCLHKNAAENIIPLNFDLADPNSFSEITKIVSSEVSHLDILINNAGYLVTRPFENISYPELEKMYRVNVFGPYALTQSLLQVLGGKQKSHIVNIGSMGGVQGSAKFAGLSAYSSSKMALAGLSECLAEEFKDKNISVNCLAIGAVKTEMLEEAFPGYTPPHTAKEMAEFIGDFAIRGHKFFNGKIIPVAVSVP
jgi:short-subunit dehydrogenase